MKVIAFIEDHAVIDRIIDHPNTKILPAAQKPSSYRSNAGMVEEFEAVELAILFLSRVWIRLSFCAVSFQIVEDHRAHHLNSNRDAFFIDNKVW